MIVTLTPNPAVDQTMWIDKLEIGEVNRPRDVYLDPAGKGINVSRMVHRLGCPTIALGFVAGDIGALVEKALDAERVAHHFIHVPGQTRINVTIVDGGKRATSFYGPGPSVAADAWGQLDELVDVWLDAARVLVVAGSLPPGIAKDAYAAHVRRARARGIKVILDADKRALKHGVEATPDVIKPNVEEAERLLDRKLPDAAAVLAGARELAARGIGLVVISMGGEGAICVQGERAWRVRPPKVERKSTVGSGDSLVAGIAVAMARGQDIVEGLRVGTAAGAATAMTAGTALGTREDVRALTSQVVIDEL